MTTFYRLEDKDGKGLFNMPDEWKTRYFYGFIKKERFQDRSYINFYNNSDYILYEIKVKDCFISKFGEVQFLKSDIISKIQTLKENIYE